MEQLANDVKSSNGRTNNRDGTIEVKDGQVTIIEQEGNGKPPMVLPSEGIVIKVNHRVIDKGTIVKKDDTITWEITEKAKPWFTIDITKEKLAVLLTINENIHKGYRIKNTRPVNQWIPRLEEATVNYDIEQYSSMIMEHLYKLGVQAKVNASTIIEELSNPTYKQIVIAQGIAPTESKDGYIEKLFTDEIEEVLEEKDGKVDYRNRFKIPTCSVGDVIAIIHPPVKGKEGVDVFGKPILPKPAKNVEVRPNRKVEIKEDGTVIARESGRPAITGGVVKYFDIVNAYTVNHDIDIKTGNIFFSGDVIINGNVQEQMRVEAMGNIFISGNVYSATIISAQDVQINGTVINSQVISGQHGLFFSEVYKIVERLYRMIRVLKSSAKTLLDSLEQQGQKISYGEVVAQLVEKKYKSIKQDILKYNELLVEIEKSHIEIPIQLKMIQRILNIFQKYHTMLNMNKDMIRSILFSLKEVLIKSEASINAESKITLNDANMSTIKTNGDIIIEKKGVIHCTLFAGKNIIFNHPKAVIRGGKVEAMGEVKASIVGSDLGNRPKVYAGEKIFIRELVKATVRIKHKTVKVHGPVSMLTIKYDEEKDELSMDPPVKFIE